MHGSSHPEPRLDNPGLLKPGWPGQRWAFVQGSVGNAAARAGVAPMTMSSSLKHGFLALLCSLTLACSTEDAPPPAEEAEAAPAPTSERPSAPPPRDNALEACEAQWRGIEASPGRAYGSGVLEKDRELFLGRARGAVTLFVREPAAPPGVKTLTKELPGTRVQRIAAKTKHDKAALRAVLLREGYVYSDDPDDSFELDARLKLSDLFDDERLVLERGEATYALTRTKTRYETLYVHDDGPRKGKPAQVLFADRVRRAGDPEAPALHRDVLELMHREGFDRMDVVRVTDGALLAKLHYGEASARAVITSEGPKLTLACLAEPAPARDAVARELDKSRWRMRAEAKMREVVSAQLDEALPFDRPRDEKGPDKDGYLRPYWLTAYMNGRPSFTTEGQTYPVYLSDGRAQPPQVCVDFVLDTYERAAGSWYTPQGQKPARPKGRLDMADHGIENRRGVLGFKKFADDNPELFAVRDFKGKERIPFAQRREFFAFLRDHHREFRAGDVLAIHGIKRDDRVHQHAILLEFSDPITGFPAGLADQMKLPRRRTWEGIMAEAPKRSLLYRARPTEAIFRPLDDGADRSQPAAITLASTEPAPAP